MLDVIPTRRELLAWAMAVILGISVVVLARADSAGANGGSPASTSVVYVATGENFPDALGAAAAAAVGLGPVLLVQPNAIPQPTLDELTRLQPPEIVIVGGTAVISPAVGTQLEGLGWGPTVTRIFGSNRYATAADLSAATFPTSGRYPLAAYAQGPQAVDVTAETVVRSVSLTAPVAGTVIVNSTAFAQEENAGESVTCGITTGASIDLGFIQSWESGGAGEGGIGQLAGTRGFDVTAGQTVTVNLICVAPAGPSTIGDSALTAIFVANT